MKKESKKIINKRWSKKKLSINNFYNNFSRLKSKINKDLKFGEEKDFLTALIILTMIKTSERVGNINSSKKNNHYGVTEFLKSHVNIINNGLIIFDYVGKSGVKQYKKIQNQILAYYLMIAIAESPSQKIFVTSYGFKINSDRVNRYLSEFEITAKDIRGFLANKMMYDRLKKINIEDDDKKRLRQFNGISRKVAEKVGHSSYTLQKHYLVPELKTKFVTGGIIHELDKKYKL